MQPDSSRPAARIPRVSFSDDILCPIEGHAYATPTLLLKRHDSIISIIIIAETGNNSSAQMLVPHCGSRLCLFCRKPLRTDPFWGNGTLCCRIQPLSCHRAAANCDRWGRRPSRKACQNRAKSCWLICLSQSEFPMLSVFVPSESSLKKAAATELDALPENAVWIDLVKPSAAEDKAVERLAGIAVPTREDMQEIEISSRLYIENSARYMTATLMCAADTQNPRTTAVTFILASHRLVTVRYDEPKPFVLVENKLARSCPP